MLTKVYNPFSVFDSFDSVTNELFKHPFKFSSVVESKTNEDGSVTFSMDLPGVKEENLTVDVSGDIVSVKAERKTKTSSQSYSKSFSLSSEYDPSTLQAELEDGVLTLTVSPVKKDSQVARRVPVSIKK